MAVLKSEKGSWVLRAARRDDIEPVRALVAGCGLPVDDVGDNVEGCVIAEQEGRIVGTATVERRGAHALLRSVAVAPGARGRQLGTALVRDRLDWATERRIESLYLLTTTAQHYFERHGFTVVERGTAPAEIQSSNEFQHLCPANATLMRHEGSADGEAIRDNVRAFYGRAAKQARTAKSSCCGGSCGADNPISADIYQEGELAGIPEDAIRASLGCGNPTLLAELREGETVLDLGAGGGIDVLLSARRVGPTGKAYGLDMTDEMLELARDNQKRAGVTNVEFLKGQIEDMPLPDGSVDVIISNCVINLSADKRRVLQEAFRVLKPGGRFAVSDIVVRREIPREVRRNAELWAGCIAGALEEWTYRKLLEDAGFADVDVVPTQIYSSAEAGLVTDGVDLDESTLRMLDGAFMSAFVRAKKP